MKLNREMTMRGKKVDMDFVSNFINTCVSNKKDSLQEICKEAAGRIEEIDFKIKEVESLKKLRSKYKDVLITLDKTVVDKSADKKALNFYSISDLYSAYDYCLYVDSLIVRKLDTLPKIEVATIKELLIANVLKREDGGRLRKGDNFKEFINFYNKNYKQT